MRGVPSRRRRRAREGAHPSMRDRARGRRRRPEPGAVGRTKQIGMRGVPSRRRRRAREGAHPSMRDRPRAEDDARSPGPSDGRSRLGGGACRAAGGAEHVRERIRRCVTERAQKTTPGSAAPRPRCEFVPAAPGSGRSAPKMRVCSGGLGLRPLRAQDASLFRRPRAQAASAPEMRARSGGFGLSGRPRRTTR
jgi:hypothetical protein